MRRHVLPRPDDLDLDARELARAAARRAGLTLEEWAATVLGRREDPSEASPARSRRADEIDGIIARMSQNARKSPGPDDAAAEAERQAAERRARDQAARTAIALDAMASWIEGAEKRLDETARASADHQERVASFLSQALPALKDRLDALERHLASERAAPQRIEFPIQEALRALNPISESLSGLRADMARLAGSLDHPARTPAVEAVRAEIEDLRSAMGGLATRQDIDALDRAMRTIARDLEPEAQNGDLATLARSIAALYGQVQILSDGMEDGAHRRIGHEIDLIKGKIDRIAEGGVDPSVIDFLTGQIVEMRQDLAHQAEPQQIARLSEDVAALGRGVADLRAAQVGRGDFAALRSSLEGVCAALSRQVAAQEASDVPEQIRHLSRRLDVLASRPEPEPADLDPIAAQLALLTERMGRLTHQRLDEADAVSDAIGRLSSQVEAVAEREPPSHEPLLQRFDRIEEELQLVGRRADISAMEAMLRSIDEKLGRAPTQPSGLDALEQRIGVLADRLAGDEAAGIAERAARAVLKDIGASLPDAGDLDALKQGFVELKALQARADKKTQESLRAVQEALGTLAARLPGQAPASPAPAGAQATPAPDALPPADRLEAAVRRLHAAALSQIDEVSAPDTGGASDPALPRHRASSPSPAPETDLGALRAGLIAAARRAAQSPAADRSEPAAHAAAAAGAQPQDSSASSSLVARLRRTLDEHRRSLLLGIGLLALAAGTAPIPSAASLPVEAAQTAAPDQSLGNGS